MLFPLVQIKLNFIFLKSFIIYCLGFHLATWTLETFGDVIAHFVKYQNFYIGMTIGTFIQVQNQLK